MSSVPAVKVINPSEWIVIIFRYTLLSSYLLAKKCSVTFTILDIFCVYSSTISSKSEHIISFTCSGLGSLIKVRENSFRNYLPSTYMGSTDPYSIYNSFSLFLLMILSTSLLTWVKIVLKYFKTSKRWFLSGWLELVLFIMLSKSISYRAILNVGWLNSLWATLLVVYVYFLHISLIYFDVFCKSCKYFWAFVAFRM